MESANIYAQQHQLQDQHVVGSNSSALVFPSCYAAGSTTHAWTPNSLLNANSFNACSNGGSLISSRDSWQQNNMMMLSSLDNTSSMTQDLGSFHWANNNIQPPGYDLHLARLKNEGSSSDSSSCSRLTELIISSSSQSMDLKDLNQKLLQRNFPSGYQIKGFQLSSEDSSSSLSSSSGNVTTTMPTNRGSCFNGQIFPTLNDLNNFNQMSLANSSSLDMNLEALDLLNSARVNEGFGQQLLRHDIHQHGFSKGGFSYGLDHFQLSSSIRPLDSPRNISSSFSNGVAEEAKRSSIMLKSKAPHQPAPKKSRIESSRASCPPFNVMKVRKEKLGDRIAALQQMVAPFGKTDTASVLMEAIGYIKFLQNQVERLSVPYMKLSRNKTRAMHGVATGNESEESKRDLRSRGLCLVPVSCLSYVTDGGGGVWPPPNFGGSV